MALNSKQKTGMIVILASLVIGILGTVWNIYGSFEALQTAENTGIGAVGDSIRNALLFSAAGLVGAIVGAFLMTFGRSRG